MSADEYPSYPCPDDPDGQHHVGCGCEFYDDDDQVALEHPAKWSAAVLVALAELVADEAKRLGRPRTNVLDPFAGRGRTELADALHAYTGEQHRVFGIELQPEWAAADPLTQVGDATALPADWTGMFDIIATSPCYGNRMADRHDAQDRCKACDGSGCTVADCLGAHPDDGQDHRLCPRCKGHGLSWRNTYAHSLRRQGGELVAGSAAGLQWGSRYRLVHRDAITEMLRVLVPGGLALVNMKNHPRDGVEQLVVEWWVNELLVRGCKLQEVRPVGTPGLGYGANLHTELKVEGEHIIAVRTPPAGQGRLV